MFFVHSHHLTIQALWIVLKFGLHFFNFGLNLLHFLSRLVAFFSKRVNNNLYKDRKKNKNNPIVRDIIMHVFKQPKNALRNRNDKKPAEIHNKIQVFTDGRNSAVFQRPKVK